MSKTTLIALSMILVSMAGCFGGGEVDEKDQGDDMDDRDWQRPGGDDDDAQVNVSTSRLHVSIDDHPTNGTFGEPMNFTWSVQTGTFVEGGVSEEDGNATTNTTSGSERRGLRETGLAWGFRSIAEPNATTDYNESMVAETDTVAPDNWTASINVTTPGQGTADDTNNSTLYVRAYAVSDNGTLHWSDEVQVEMSQAIPPGTTIVRIAGSGLLASYEPGEITIRVGDSVVWTNNDTLELTHTATSRSGPVEFDTGDIAPGAASAPIVFDTPGTYTYACDNHATMEEATIIVTATNETGG